MAPSHVRPPARGSHPLKRIAPAAAGLLALALLTRTATRPRTQQTESSLEDPQTLTPSALLRQRLQEAHSTSTPHTFTDLLQGAAEATNQEDSPTNSDDDAAAYGIAAHELHSPMAAVPRMGHASPTTTASPFACSDPQIPLRASPIPLPPTLEPQDAGSSPGSSEREDGGIPESWTAPTLLPTSTTTRNWGAAIAHGQSTNGRRPPQAPQQPKPLQPLSRSSETSVRGSGRPPAKRRGSASSQEKTACPFGPQCAKGKFTPLPLERRELTPMQIKMEKRRNKLEPTST